MKMARSGMGRRCSDQFAEKEDLREDLVGVRSQMEVKDRGSPKKLDVHHIVIVQYL